MRTWNIRAETDRALQVVTPANPVSGLTSSHAEKGIRFAKCRIQAYSCLKLSSRFFLLPSIPERYAKIVVSARKIWVQSDRITELLHCGRQIAQLSENEAEQIMGFGIIRIRFQRFFKFPLSALHVSLREELSTSIVAIFGRWVGRMVLVSCRRRNLRLRLCLKR